MRSLALLLGLSSLLLASSPELDQARKLYKSTDFDKSLKILRAIPNKDGAVWELIGCNYYMEGDYKKATDALEKAVALEPDSSWHALWLGRAYGRRAETSFLLTAPGYAGKARDNFQKAVRLDPGNTEALSDLMEFYLGAPGILGGGYDKAAAVAEQIARLNPAEGHFAQARLAETKKQYQSAESHLELAIQNAPQQVGRIVDLAKFLAQHGRLQEAEQNLAKAEKIAPNSPKLLYERADVYIESGQNLDLAKELLKRYLASPLTVDDPPRSDAEKLLRKAQGS